MRPYAKKAFYSRPVSPLVSIVIPVYNVERYLPQCLDSVLSQSYTNLQVLLVDDGSPDNSIDIMNRYAEQDRRVQIIRQANAGLGAARNTGARYAKGTFLMFIDSDDVLKPDAIRTYVRALRRSGSDFAVSGYERMNSSRTWPAAWWIRAAHRFSRLGTNLIDSPDICVNAVAWSKFYRRSFWEQNGFAFPVGVLYEDQALSTRAYARAAAFDILSNVTYGWRVREDRTSITQQSTALKDLRARLHAAENSLAELSAPRLRHVRNVRLGQYLSNDFPLSIRSAQHADDEFWQLLTDGLRRLTADADDEVWERVSAQHRIAIRLVTEGHRDAAIDFVGLGHNNTKNIRPVVGDGAVYLDTPARHVLGMEATDPLLALAQHQLGLVTSIRRAYWDSEHRYHIEGWAYIDNVDLAQCSTDVRLTAVERASGFEYGCDVTMLPNPEVTAATKHRYADYEPSCFHAVFDLPAAIASWQRRPRDDQDAETASGQQFDDVSVVTDDSDDRASGQADSVPADADTRNTVTAAHTPIGHDRTPSGAEEQDQSNQDGDEQDAAPSDRSDWQLYVAVTSAGISREGLLVGLEHGGSAGRLQADFLPDGSHVEVGYSGKNGLHFPVRRPPYEVSDVRLDGRSLTVSVLSTSRKRPHSLELTGNRSKQVVKATLNQAAGATGPQDRYRTTFDVPEPGLGIRSGNQLTGETWTVRVVAEDGRRYPAAWPDEATPAEFRLANPRADRTQFGNLGIIDEPAAVRVQAAEFSADGLRLTGTLVGGDPDQLLLRLHTGKARSQTRATSTGDGRFTAMIALQADPWGLGALPLPTGEYALSAELDGRDIPVPVRAGDELIRQLPIIFADLPTPTVPGGRLRGQLRLHKPNLLCLRLELPFTDADRGSRRQQAHQDRLQARHDDPQFEAGAVLLRSYYGEICGCNPRALSDYLVREQLAGAGRPYQVYWAIKDYSVRVPDGTIAVLHESAEWYRLLHDAQYYMDNMHQPVYDRKPAHQVQIQTFHGYPFKQMGLSHWAMQGRDVAHINSYLQRADDWDYLVSPASYGTEALCREFGFHNTVLEIGYPRNDVLFSPDAATIAETVRHRLGVGSDQTAVLYAPTFRDGLSVDDNTAAMIDFLDLDELAARLGPHYVIMVRGHAFNARLANRVGSRGSIIDVTDYPDIAELCLASDAAILDYSSLRFDYGLTGQPMIFHVPDLVQYSTEARGSLWDYEPTAPGPLLSTTDEVIEAVVNLDRIRDEYAETYATFRESFLDLDDGHATERLYSKAFG